MGVGFEKFDRASAAAATKDPEVVVLMNGVISLTWRAYEMLGTPEYVEFYFDRANRRVGIAAAEDKSNGYQVRLPRVAGKSPGEAKGKVSIRGATFFKFYGIEPTAKYKATPEFTDNMLTFEAQNTAENEATQVSAPTVHRLHSHEEAPF